MGALILNAITFNNVKFAITQKEQEYGLMGEAYPPPIMVFPFKIAKIRKFWMKNTLAPLDIIFCNARKVIHIARGIPLDSDNLIGPNKACDLVIETPAGFCYDNSISLGSFAKIKYDKRILTKLLHD